MQEFYRFDVARGAMKSLRAVLELVAPARWSHVHSMLCGWPILFFHVLGLSALWLLAFHVFRIRFSGMSIAAAVFSLIYFVELVLFGIGAFKEGGGRGFLYAFLAAIVLLWIGYFFLRRRELRYRTASFIVFGLVLLGWVVPAWRIELGVERQEDAQFYEDVARMRALDVHDEPLLSPRGNPLGVRIRYAITLPSTRTLALDPQLRPLLDGMFPESMGSYFAMDYAHTAIEPPPSATYPDPLGTGAYGKYRGGVMYHFSVDLTPRFLLWNQTKTRFCICVAEKDRRQFHDLIQRSSKIKYSVYIENANYGIPLDSHGAKVTEHDYSPKTFFEGAVKEGAKDCPTS